LKRSNGCVLAPTHLDRPRSGDAPGMNSAVRAGGKHDW
jgi:hypothetical protein